MLESRLFALALVTLVLAGTTALAQGSGPAEIPPVSYAGNQYVDSNGCAFVRAGVSGNVVWIPRVGNDRRALCGFRPTFAPETAIAAAPAPAPVAAPELTPVTAPAPTVAAAAPRPASTPAPTRAPTRAPASANAPIATVASVTTPPRVGIVPAGPTAASPATVPAAPAAEPRRLTLAQACEGRSGVQVGLIDSRSGQPVDCGSAPVAATPAAQVNANPAAAPMPSVAAATTSGPDVTIRRMTRADICAEIAATSAVYIDRAAGLRAGSGRCGCRHRPGRAGHGSCSHPRSRDRACRTRGGLSTGLGRWPHQP